MQEDLLSNEMLELSTVRRKKLLPWWIKIFSWIFIVLGVFAVPSIIFGVLGYKFTLSIYGIETNEPFSMIGVSVISIFLLKGVTAFGLLKEKDWAITVATIDAVLGILFCILLMINPMFNSNLQEGINFKLEILILIPYLIFLRRIRTKWNNAVEGNI